MSSPSASLVSSSALGGVLVIISPSFARGVDGTTRKKESILFNVPSLLLTGTESERDICCFLLALSEPPVLPS
uniref:Uncharacterized protein MANES_11G144500 n=1 Tax=Rhizophora mucronata TaxID=61149 RepID=A0A2P2JTU5_RHIMU